MTRGLYTVGLVSGDSDLTEAQALRHLAFRRHIVPESGSASGAAGARGHDSDDFDLLCRHMLVREPSGALVACCRILSFSVGQDLSASYAAQVYDLTGLSAFPGPRMELGRFCLHPARHDPDILRLIWGALTAVVDAEGVRLLFGCSSFVGADPAPHLPALAALRRYIGPADYLPGPRAAQRVAFPEGPGKPAGLPPLLRSYLTMGAWVSDHAVIDRDLDTLHVFTALPIAQVPATRARALRAVAAVSG
jgi:putative hemolysin